MGKDRVHLFDGFHNADNKKRDMRSNRCIVARFKYMPHVPSEHPDFLPKRLAVFIGACTMQSECKASPGWTAPGSAVLLRATLRLCCAARLQRSVCSGFLSGALWGFKETRYDVPEE